MLRTSFRQQAIVENVHDSENSYLGTGNSFADNCPTCRGAAGTASSADGISKCCPSFLYISPRVEALRQGLRDLGYVDGQNIVIEYRFAEGKLDQVSHNAAELVRLKVDVIVTAGSTDTAAARKATATIPVVMTQDNDPVGSGFVAALARPGGNITGLTNISSELSGKRLELLKEVVPRLSRVVIFGNAANPGNAQALKGTEDAARAMGMKLQHLEVRKLEDIESAFNVASREQSQAIMILPNPVASAHLKQVAELAVRVAYLRCIPERICGVWWSHELRREHN